MTFDEWWKKLKPAECDELEPYFRECWREAVASGCGARSAVESDAASEEQAKDFLRDEQRREENNNPTKEMLRDAGLE